MPQSLSRRLIRLLAALASVAAVAFAGYRILGINATTAAIVFLLTVLVIAAQWGIVEAASASVAAMLCFNYFFLPPIGTLTIEDPQNWVALVAFLATSIIGSQLSARARQRAEEALSRRQEMERLYELSCALLLTESGQAVAAGMARHIVRVFGCEAIAFHDRRAGQTFRAGTNALGIPDSRLAECAQQGTEFHDTEAGAVAVPVRLGGQIVGSLGVPEGAISEAALHAVANLSAIALEREIAQAAAARAEADRHGEELKSTLLDAVAHEFKTPLTSIKAAATAMLSTARKDSPEQELLTIVDEETERLNEMVTEAIQMSRIEAGKVHLSKHSVPVRELVDDVVKSSLNFLEDRRVNVRAPANLPDVTADPELIALVLRQILNNAAKYSPPGAAVEIEASVSESSVVIAVSDEGPGIPESEQVKIFDKFYRSPGVRDRQPGTGMGLTLAREIVHAHKGQIWVDSAAGRGTRFSFSLPAATGEKN